MMWTEKINVHVEIINDNTGHSIPTDYPGRQLILLVQAFDQQGNSLNLIDGSVLPDWTGIGDPLLGYYEGLPGQTFAKILEETWTGISPTIAYWNLFMIISDNRIKAFEIVENDFIFTKPGDEKTSIEVSLKLRRNYIQVMDWEQRDSPDILIANYTNEIGKLLNMV